MATKALKAKNNPMLWAVVTADVLANFAIASSDSLTNAAAWTSADALRGVFASCVPVVVLLLNSLVPARAKAVMVFWRVRNVLPGHRAFSKHAADDPRIDIERLRKNIGAFPENPREQNATWYRLFKKVEMEAAVDHAHQQFLLLRDVASLSVLLLLAVVLAMLAGGLTSGQAGIAVLLFGIQYVLAAISAAAQGRGLVRSVLALHSVKRRV